MYDSDNVAEATGARPLTWSVVYGPVSFQINQTTGLINWYPDAPGSYSIVLMVENSYGSAIQAFTVYVSLPDSGGGSATQTTVPRLIGYTLNASSDSISQAQLSLRDISFAFSDSVPINCVIRQIPSPGTVVNKNYPVDLLVSKGIQGNTDTNNKIDLFDFSTLVRCWDHPASVCPGVDFDRNGYIGFGDLLILSERWLNTGPVKLYEILDGNPSWGMTGQWECGIPRGLGGYEFGYSDPDRGYTGNIVYGVNLYGNYNTAQGGPYYLTAGPFNCFGYKKIILKFARWLNIDEPFYAQAFIEVSNNGSNWNIVWWNQENTPITDNQWKILEYDISQYAENRPQVFIRWGYQVYPWAYPYSGWNIDDIQIIGFE